MRRVSIFQELLRQMSVQFTLSDVVKCVFYWNNQWASGFMLAMANGEYWYLTSVGTARTEVTPAGVFKLFKYPPPIPAITELPLMPLRETIKLETDPRDINDYIKEMGGAESLFLDHKE